MRCSHHAWQRNGTCYFCNSNQGWKDVSLADGCTVPACAGCFSIVAKGRKPARERGHYNDANSIRGGDSMKAERRSEGGNYLKVAEVEARKIMELKIVGEVVEVEFAKDGKTTRKYHITCEFR